MPPCLSLAKSVVSRVCRSQNDRVAHTTTQTSIPHGDRLPPHLSSSWFPYPWFPLCEQRACTTPENQLETQGRLYRIRRRNGGACAHPHSPLQRISACLLYTSDAADE